MPSATKADIKRRHADLKLLKEPWLPLWKDVNDHVLPRRSFWNFDQSDGKLPDTKVWDDSPLYALQMFVDWLQGNLVSPSIRWFRLKMQQRQLNGLPGVADWLEELEDVLYSEFQRSNFYQAISEYFVDAGSLGTSAMFVEDDVAHKRTHYSTRHLMEYCIAEDRYGNIDTLYREYYMTNRAALQQWGNKLDPKRLAVAETQPFGKAHLLHAVFPRNDRDFNRIDQLNQPWASRYIDLDYDTDIDEGGFRTFPYCTWRYRKNTSEVYGRSPAIDAIRSILRLNAIALTDLKAAQMAVEPPLNVPVDMKGEERIVPRGFNYYTKGDMMISPINLAQNYSIGKDIKEDIRNTVREHFHTARLLLADQAERQMTAREVIERQGEKAILLGVIMGGLNGETLIPVILREYDICDRNGLIPEPPRALQTGGRIQIEFMGPLAQAQRRYHQVQGMTAGFQFMIPVGQAFPESMDNVDGDELMRIGLDANGMPQKVIRELPERDSMRRQAAAATAQQQKAAQAAQQQALVAQNANKLNEPVKPDSILDRLAKAATTVGQ